MPWNVAPGTIWLVGSPAVVAAAATMDEVFWDHRDQFIQQTAPGEEVWRQARDRMETARLHFINAARPHVDPRHTRLTQVPVSRPPLPHLTDSGADQQPDGRPTPDASDA
ncbi:hypothetical protein [Streptomyces yerevanensis]|uniref:hypothetical protein n=1 Tax=Streptomyces yerevanensis TaxID=66378 RepID=UPI001B804AB4|nr:hypothetical protein [Streptomyces yerevanensis]